MCIRDRVRATDLKILSAAKTPPFYICLLYTSGSTPIDFAYRIHSRVGDTCVGAKVNGRIVPLDTELNTGDVVQIQTRKDGHPSRDWLLIAKTNNAKNRIRGWFKREMKDENIAKGKEMLEKEAKRKGFDLYKDCLLYTS